MTTHVYVLSGDSRWLSVVAYDDKQILVEAILCGDGVLPCLDSQLRAGARSALLVVDAGEEADVADLVRAIIKRGWKHIVVVGNDSRQWQKAKAAIQAGAQDYLLKSNFAPIMHKGIQACLKEMGAALCRGTTTAEAKPPFTPRR